MFQCFSYKIAIPSNNAHVLQGTPHFMKIQCLQYREVRIGYYLCRPENIGSYSGCGGGLNVCWITKHYKLKSHVRRVKQVDELASTCVCPPTMLLSPSLCRNPTSRIVTPVVESNANPNYHYHDKVMMNL